MTNAKDASYVCICDLSGDHGGFVSREQLTAHALSRGTIASWVLGRRLIHVWSGVFAVGHVPTEPRARAFGAVLAAGADSAIAGWSAAAFYGAVKHWPETYELLSPRRVRIEGLTVHRSGTLLLRDVWRFDGLRVTSPARTALDLAPQTTAARRRAMVDHLRLRHSLSLRQITDVAERNPRHAGARLLLELVGQSGRRPTRSQLERRWRHFARNYGLPPYEQNTTVAGYEADVLIDGLVIVEIDTFGTHLLNFESDRARDADILARTGIPTIRITDTQLSESPATVAAQIVAVVEAQRALKRRAR